MIISHAVEGEGGGSVEVRPQNSLVIPPGAGPATHQICHLDRSTPTAPIRVIPTGAKRSGGTCFSFAGSFGELAIELHTRNQHLLC